MGVAALLIPLQHLQTLHRTGTAAARAWALSSPTPAPPVTRSTPSAGQTGTGAQAPCLSVAIRELRQVQALQLRNQERNQARSLGRSLGRSQERSRGRNQERNPERNQERSRERSQEKERNQTKVEQEQRIVLNVTMWLQNN